MNETDERYASSLVRLKQKCLNSKFNKKIVNESFEKIKIYKNLWTTNKEEKITEKETQKVCEKKKEMIPWASSMKQLMSLNRKEKNLIPNSQIVYSRPNTLRTILTNYKKISMGENRTENKQGSSKGCQKCSLCGKFGNHKSMIKETTEITTKTNRKIKLKQDLNCKNYGIYAAQFIICLEIYVGQTINPFHERWNGHRKDWENEIKNGDFEQTLENFDEKRKKSLIIHYAKFHLDKLKDNKIKLPDAYKVVFVEESNKTKLDIAENFWISKLKAKINIARTILPFYK